MKTYKKVLLFIALITLSAAGQGKGTLSGKVSDLRSKETLSGANVVVYTDQGKKDFITSAACNKDGDYLLQEIEAGSYWVFASFIGYEESSFRLDIRDGENIKHDFRLNPKFLETKQAVIEGKRDSIRSVGVIDISPEFLKLIPTMSGEIDLFRALTMLPGVTTSSEISSGLYVRGGSPDQNLTLIDGVMLYNPFHLGGFASTFNSDAVKDIRMIKGGFPARYGGRLSSILDITLKEGSSQGISGVIGVGTNTSRITLEGPISAKSTFIVSGRKMYMDIVQKGALPSNKIIPLYNFYDLNGKFVYKISQQEKLVLSGYFGNDRLYSPLKSEDVEYDINWGNTMLNLSWLHLTEEEKFTKILLGFTSYKFNTLIQKKSEDAFKQDFFSTSIIRDYSLKIEGQYFSNQQHTLRNGIEVTLHDFDLINNNYFSDVLKKDERFQTNLQSIETSGFIEDQWLITPLLSSNFGVRLAYFLKTRYFNYEPRVSLNYNLTDRITLKAGYASVNQALHLIIRNDVVLPTDIWFPSSKEIKPARSEQISVGIDYEFADREYLISAEGYFKKLSDLYEYGDTAVFSFEAPIEKQFTQGRGEAYGFELFINRQIGDLSGWVGYTLSWTRRYFDKINYGLPFYPRYDRRHDLSVVLGYKFTENIEFGLTWIYATGQAYTMPTGQYYFAPVNSQGNQNNYLFLDYTNINDYRLPAYHKMDVSASYKFDWNKFGMKLTFSVYNVYNRQNPLGRYVNYKLSGTDFPLAELKQFTLFPFFPSISLTMNFK